MSCCFTLLEVVASTSKGLIVNEESDDVDVGTEQTCPICGKNYAMEIIEVSFKHSIRIPQIVFNVFRNMHPHVEFPM